MDIDRARDVSAYAIALPSNVDAPGTARAFIHAHSAHLPPHVIDDALILVTELVSNAVLHGRPSVTLQVRIEPPGIGVAVTDDGDAFALTPPSPPDPRSTSGRGLLIVDRLASRWGIEQSEPLPGKTVWFELAAD